MQIQLSEHFDYKKLLRFALPSIVMKVFSSLYSGSMGYLYRTFVGKTPFASINLIMPFLMICGAVGFMLGSGGSALVAKTLGQHDDQRARQIFSMNVCFMIGFSIVLAAVGLHFIRPISILLGAEGAMIDDCVAYASILLPMLPTFILQYTFQPFLVTAERPNFGLYVTLGAGLTNIILDALFIVGFGWGLQGATWATVLSQAVGGLVPLAFFIYPNKSRLRLCRAHMDWRALLCRHRQTASGFRRRWQRSWSSPSARRCWCVYDRDTGISSL